MTTVLSAFVVGLAIGLLFEIVDAYRSRKPEESFSFAFERIVSSLRLGLASSSFLMLAAVTADVASVSKRAESTTNSLQAADVHLRDLGHQSIFGQVAVARVEQFSAELDRISNSEMALQSQDEVLQIWARCIELSNRAIRATNIVSPVVWRSGKMGERAKELHREVIGERDVGIKRLWIVDKGDPVLEKEVSALASEYSQLGVENRYVDLSTLERVDGYSTCRDGLGTNDFVVFDESVVLLSSTSSRNDVLSGRLSAARAKHVDLAGKCFDLWWQRGRGSISGESR